MKNLNLLFAFLLVFIAFSCQNASVDNENAKNENIKDIQNGTESNSEKDINSDDKSVEKTKTAKTIVAEFEMLIASTGGTYYRFVDEKGEEWDFYHAESIKALEFAMSLQPGSTDHKYYHKTFKLTYENRDITRKGETESLPVIISAIELSAEEIVKERSTISAAFSDSEIQSAMFFGTEPFWDMQFYDSYVQKGDPSGTVVKFYYVVNGKSGKYSLKQAIKSYSENGVSIDVTDESGAAIAEIVLVKELCNDGMSENTYPYSISFKWEDGGGWNGCGRINTKEK